jgi:hypothetical protein
VFLTSALIFKLRIWEETVSLYLDRIEIAKHMPFRIMQSEDCSLVGCDAVSLGQQFPSVEGSLCVCLPSGASSHPRRFEFSVTPLREPQMSHYLNCLQMELELHLLIQ